MINFVTTITDETDTLQEFIDHLRNSGIDLRDWVSVVDSTNTRPEIEDILKANGVHYYVNPTHYISDQSNFLYSKCWHPWVFGIDMDERVTEPLVRLLRQTIANQPSYNAFAFPRWTDLIMDVEETPEIRAFLDTYLKGVAWPDNQLRLHKLSPDLLFVGRFHSALLKGERLLTANTNFGIVAVNEDVKQQFAIRHIKRVSRMLARQKIFDAIENREPIQDLPCPTLYFNDRELKARIIGEESGTIAVVTSKQELITITPPS